MAIAQVFDDNGHPLPVLGLGTAQEVTVGAASAQSAAFALGTRVIRVVSTTACRILIASNPTAVATSPLLPANVVEFLKVQSQEKIAVIQESAGGKLSITEMI